MLYHKPGWEPHHESNVFVYKVSNHIIIGAMLQPNRIGQVLTDKDARSPMLQIFRLSCGCQNTRLVPGVMKPEDLGRSLLGPAVRCARSNFMSPFAADKDAAFSQPSSRPAIDFLTV